MQVLDGPHDRSGAILISAGIAALIAGWGIFSQRAITRRRVTVDIIARSEWDKDVIAARKRFIELARAEGGLSRFAEEAVEHEQDTQYIRLVLNEFELIAIGIQRGVIDFQLYRRWYRAGVIRYWMFAKPFVERLRERTANQALYHEFEEMARWMQSAKPKVPRRFWWFGKIT